ncbi:substrate-binding periplasmic protein [Chitinimonas naiadis]
MAYLDTPAEPFILGRGAVAKPPGLVVEWALRAVAATGCSPRISLTRQPAVRLDMALTSGDLDILIGVAATPEREQKHAYPGNAGGRLLYVAQADISFYTTTETGIDWNSQKPNLKNVTVGVARGQMPAAIAENHGWRVDLAPDNVSNYRKLINGRVPLILETSLLADPYFQANPAPGLHKLSPPVMRLDYYSPASRSFYRDYAGFTEQYWLQLCRFSRDVLKQLPACRLD